jgi:hypothetical protein
MPQKIFNNWLIYYQVDSAADISSLLGNKIDKKFLKKLIREYMSKSTLNWPRQKTPNARYYNIWINTLKTICQSNEQGVLKEKLGEWTVEPTYYFKYNALMHKTTGHIIIKEQNISWQMIPKSHSVRAQIYFSLNCINNIRDIKMGEYTPIEYQQNS